MQSFEKVLVANRGEIAVRVIRACRRLGISPVAVYSDADRHSYAVAQADEAVHIGGSAASESYLGIEKIIAAALSVNAQAIHPGYGFLAESAELASACRDAGLVFIGPEVAAMAAMASKEAARKRVDSLNLPTIPGSEELPETTEALRALAAQIGYPVLLKAAAGGGGLGMRVVERSEELSVQLQTVRREAQQAFGDDTIVLEKYLSRARHIEIQLLADTHGNVVHLHERECSLQRRRQKIIEESPARNLSAAVKSEMAAAALKICQAIDYCGAGTIEFLLDSQDQFYFLEMNTRLQVEHPVTEAVTGIDIVEWQIRIAQGQPLNFEQKDIVQKGHAIECRLCAEEPERDFAPSTGTILYWQQADSARCDTGVAVNSQLSVHYDSLMAKLICHADEFATANRKMKSALAQMRIMGVRHNINYLRHIIDSDCWIAGNIDTQCLERQHAQWIQPASTSDQRLLAGLAAVLKSVIDDTDTAFWPGAAFCQQRFSLSCGEDVWMVSISRVSSCEYSLCMDESERVYRLLSLEPLNPEAGLYNLSVEVQGRKIVATLCSLESSLTVAAAGFDTVHVNVLPGAQQGSPAMRDNLVLSPMPAKIVAINTSTGDSVAAGAAMLVLESMKMETVLAAPCSGKVVAVSVAVGDLVESGSALMEIDWDQEAL